VIWFVLITKGVCTNYNLNGDGDSLGYLSPRGTEIRKKCTPQAFVGIPAEKFLCRGDGMGSYSPVGNG
jgi:hypothetical protein